MIPIPLSANDPDRLGAYELIGRLGSGGQGTVYLARPAGAVDTAPRVAIKLLHTRLLGDANARARFVRELAVLQRVAGFCTAQMLEADMAGDQPYIVSEFVPGPSLAQLVQDEGPRVGADLDRLAIGSVTALAAIHRAGIVHRDLKPANVLIGPDGPRVIDFGIARALDAGATLTSQIVGTPAYMAPEQFSATSIGPSADLFAWAATVLYAATGRDPFGGGPLPAVMYRVFNDDPDLSALPAAVAEIVISCLAKDPLARPSAEDTLLWLLGQRNTADLAPPQPNQAQPGSPPGHGHSPSHEAAPQSPGAPDQVAHGSASPPAAARPSQDWTYNNGVSPPQGPPGSAQGRPTTPSYEAGPPQQGPPAANYGTTSPPGQGVPYDDDLPQQGSPGPPGGYGSTPRRGDGPAGQGVPRQEGWPPSGDGAPQYRDGFAAQQGSPASYLGPPAQGVGAGGSHESPPSYGAPGPQRGVPARDWGEPLSYEGTGRGGGFSSQQGGAQVSTESIGGRSPDFVGTSPFADRAGAPVPAAGYERLRRTPSLVVGLVLAMLLAVLDIASLALFVADPSLTKGRAAFMAAASAFAVLAIVTIVAAVFAWRGSRGAVLTVILVRLAREALWAVWAAAELQARLDAARQMQAYLLHVLFTAAIVALLVRGLRVRSRR